MKACTAAFILRLFWVNFCLCRVQGRTCACAECHEERTERWVWFLQAHPVQKAAQLGTQIFFWVLLNENVRVLKFWGLSPSLSEHVLAFKSTWKSNQTHHLKVKPQRISAITSSTQKSPFYSEHTPRQFSLIQIIL